MAQRPRNETTGKPGPLAVAMTELGQLVQQVGTLLEQPVEQAGLLIKDALAQGHKVMACGNGGSAGDAQHLVAELVGHMRRERAPLAAIALTADSSVVTALANDYGYEQVFARQVEALGQPGDVLIAISTSGKSSNVLAALEAARAQGLKTIALLGEKGDRSLEMCDVTIHVPSRDTQRIQEIHIALLHVLCEYLESDDSPASEPAWNL